MNGNFFAVFKEIAIKKDFCSKVTERGDKILLAKVNKLAQHNSFLKEEIEQMKQKNNSMMKDLNIYSHKLRTHLVLEQKLSQGNSLFYSFIWIFHEYLKLILVHSITLL